MKKIIILLMFMITLSPFLKAQVTGEDGVDSTKEEREITDMMKSKRVGKVDWQHAQPAARLFWCKDKNNLILGVKIPCTLWQWLFGFGGNSGSGSEYWGSGPGTVYWSSIGGGSGGVDIKYSYLLAEDGGGWGGGPGGNPPDWVPPKDSSDGHTDGHNIHPPDTVKTGLEDDSSNALCRCLPTSNCPREVKFKEHPSQLFGFDNKTNESIPWQSVEQGKSEKLKINIKPASASDKVFFKVVTPSILTVAPTHATSADFDFTVTEPAWTATQIAFDDKHECEVQANCTSVDGDNISKLKVVAYKALTINVAVTLVHSKSHPTPNGNYAGYLSSDILNSTLEGYLNKCYSQAIVKWQVISHNIKTIDFDSNSDGKVDNTMNGSTFSSELRAIHDGCKDPNADLDIMNFYLVDNPIDVETIGLSRLGSHYSFIFVNASPDPAHTCTHEAGHSYFKYDDLPDSDSDKENLMFWKYRINTQAKLRKLQWDAIQR